MSKHKLQENGFEKQLYTIIQKKKRWRQLQDCTCSYFRLWQRIVGLYENFVNENFVINQQMEKKYLLNLSYNIITFLFDGHISFSQKWTIIIRTIEYSVRTHLRFNSLRANVCKRMHTCTVIVFKMCKYLFFSWSLITYWEKQGSSHTQ